jgi:antitoxin component of MazEF toxin-antitoxin module
MIISEIVMIDGVLALRVTPEVLEALGVEIGDEVEIITGERKLMVYVESEAERAARARQIVAELLFERDSAYRRLAEGVE